jgi:hypothetical protein
MKYGFVDKVLSCNITEHQCMYKLECVETDLIQAGRILNTVIKKILCFLYIFLRIHVGRNALHVGSPRLPFYNKNSHNILRMGFRVLPKINYTEIYNLILWSSFSRLWP